LPIPNCISPLRCGPDFDAKQLDAAIACIASASARFGRTSEQLEKAKRETGVRRRIA